MTEFEKQIYNKHLAISRSSRNKAFKLKKDFSKFEDDARYLYIKKLSIFFTKYSEVDMDMYFSAPYKLYLDVEYFDLNYFASPRAIKSYSIYKQELEQLSPDKQLDDVKKSLQFIAKYCLKNNISLDKYIYHKNIGIHPEWMYHIKLNNINLYSLMEFPNILDSINELSEEDQYMLFGKTQKELFNYKTNYLRSNLNKFLKVAIRKINNFIENNLKDS